jgi:transposase
MLEALIAGERNPQVLAELARGRLRVKIPALAEALAGRFAEHHAFLARMIGTHLDAISAMVAEPDARIDAELAPYRPQVELLDSSDGIETRTAQVIIAEIGVDMGRFPRAALASRAGVCPGNNKTAGKPTTASTRPGDRWLKAALGTAALGALRRKDSYLHALFRRIAVRRGGKRALAAVAHSQLVTVWQVLTTQTRY